MTANMRLTKARKILATLGVEMNRATALQKLWVRCADKPDILDAMNVSHETWGFNIVRDSLQRDLIVTLLKILERGQDRSACIQALLKITDDDQVVDVMKAQSTKPSEVDFRIARAKQAFAHLEADGMLKALRTLRDKVIAHVEFGQVAHGAKIGYERKVLERAIPIFEDLAVAVRDREFGLERTQDLWGRHAEAFWSHVARPRR